MLRLLSAPLLRANGRVPNLFQREPRRMRFDPPRFASMRFGGRPVLRIFTTFRN